MKVTAKIALVALCVAAVGALIALPSRPVLRLPYSIDDGPVVPSVGVMHQEPANGGIGFGFVFQPQSDAVVPSIIRPLWGSDMGFPAELWFMPSRIEVGGLFGVADETAQVGAALYGVWPRRDFELLGGVAYMDSWEQVSFEGFAQRLGLFVGGRFRL